MAQQDFTISLREVQDGMILDLRGRLTMGDPVALLRDRVHTVISAGKKKIGINLSGVSFADSSGVGAMMGALTTAETAGAQCKFFGVPPQLQTVLKHVRLDEVLDLRASEATLLASWKEG